MAQETGTAMGPPPPYAPTSIPQTQAHAPYSFPPPPPNGTGWNQNPGFLPQPPPAPSSQQPHWHQHQAHQAPQLQPPYQPYQQLPQNPTPSLWPSATPQSQPTPYPHPQPQTHQQQTTPLPQHVPPAFPINHIPLEYPYVPTAKRQMTLLSPDRAQPLLTVVYPSSWSTTPKLTIHRGGGPDGPEMGGALFHSFTTEKVDAFLVAPGGGKFDYRFRKKFRSHVGLAGTGGGKMKWAIEDGAMVLSDEGGKGGSSGGYVARFVARDGGKGVKGATSRLEGRLEIRRAGLTGLQFEEVFVTLVAEMERKRRDNEDWEILEAVWKHSSGSGSGGEEWGGFL